MNRDDIIRMARECGLTVNDAPMLGVERFADLVAAAEREACAKLADDCVNIERLADDIRARDK